MNFFNNILYRGGAISQIKSTSWQTILVVILAILFIVIAIIYYYYYVVPSMKPKYTQKVGSGDSDKTANLMLFYVDWCPHCKTAKPEWNKLKDEYQDRTINGYVVTFTEINCTEETPDVTQLMNQYKIESYPTIKLVKDGQIIEYDAKPNKDTLVQFLNTVL